MKEKLDELKKKYSVLKKKYGLPEFEKLNEDFEIECVAEEDTEFLLRRIRKQISDKLSFCFRFFEVFVGGESTSTFFLILFKSITNKDRETINKFYSALGEFEIRVLGLESSYSEKNEADFIKDAYSEWQKLKKELDSFVSNLRRYWKESKPSKKDKRYLG